MRAAYTFSHSYDAQSLTSSRAISNWNFGRDEGAQSLTSTDVSRSIYDQPNKLLISGTYHFPWKTLVHRLLDDLSGLHRFQPFDYVYTGTGGRGDLNGDGDVNDMIYIPKNVFDPTEIQFAPIASAGKATILPATQQLALYNLIQNTPCLKAHQGEIMSRNACYNPWVNRFDASINQSLPASERSPRDAAHRHLQSAQHAERPVGPAAPRRWNDVQQRGAAHRHRHVGA